MVRASATPKEGLGITMELWDEFLGAMKSTHVFEAQLGLPWGADVDMFSPESETRLGLD